MKENVGRLYQEEIREKRVTASGVHGRKGKRGLVGKMITPADLAGREYRAAHNLGAFNLYDLFHKLQEAPTLKSVLIGRMDEEYRNYRNATEKTLDAVLEIVKMGLEPLEEELAALRAEVEILRHKVERMPSARTERLLVDPDGDGTRRPLRSAPGGRRRIRWGSTPEAIRSNVFEQLRRLVAMGEEVNTETIKEHVPSMLRWIYGEKALFSGIEGLRREFEAATGLSAGTRGEPGDRLQRGETGANGEEAAPSA